VTSRRRQRRRFSLLLFFAAAICARPPAARAQEPPPTPIRVETRYVYVPVLVLDKTRIDYLQRLNPRTYAQKLAANALDFGAIAIRNLNAENFRLFEDGREQKIQTVTPDFQLARPVQDNLGLSEDFVGAGGGIWVAPGVSVDQSGDTVLNVPDWPGYLIAYAPTGEPDGRCHHIAVKVDRPPTLVFGRTDYCNNADPLKDTALGKQMQSDLTSRKKGEIGLSLAAVDLFTGTRASRVQIAVDFSPNRIFRVGEGCYGLPEIHILGLIYAKDGTLAARFSDFTSRNFSPRGEAMPLLLSTSAGFVRCSVTGPTYETQIDLAPGQYNLRVALRDGTNVGRAEIPFTVETNQQDRLAISGIALVRRFHDVPAESRQLLTALPVNYAPLLSREFELTPTADSAFERNQRLYFYFELFEPVPTETAALAVQAHVRVVDAKSGEVKNDLRPFSAAPFMKPGNSVIPVSGGIDISGLPKGSYRIEVQATDSAGGSTPWRTANFTVQ
jgi:hypothetical protein